MSKSVAIIATLDTKGEEVSYLKQCVLDRGHQVVVIDVGSRAPSLITADISADEIAEAGGARITELRQSNDRVNIAKVMAKGAVAKTKQLCEAGEVNGVVTLGGASAAFVASVIMRELPFGIPKLVVTSAASILGNVFGPADVTVMDPMLDIGSLNSLLKAQLSKAAGAICGMVDAETTIAPSERKRCALTTYGYIENCAHYVSQALEAKYEIVRFHAVGSPEVTMEKLIEQGVFAGVIDLVPSSISCMAFGGSRVSSPERLEVAGRKGIPQVIAPAGVNTYARVNFTQSEIADKIKTRRHYFIDPQRVSIWLTPVELRKIAPIYAEKLNKAVGPTSLVIPLKGWLSVEREGTPLYDPRDYKSFLRYMRKNLKSEITIIEVDANIDDPEFAQAVVEAFEEVMRRR